jgi:hypothetical protein
MTDGRELQFNLSSPYKPTMLNAPRTARLCAAAIAFAAWTGLILQFAALLTTHSVLGTLWTMSRFFTITTNLAIAILFALLAIGHRRSSHPRLLAGVMVAILLVGVVYGLLLEGLMPLKGLAIPANFLMHKVTPILVPLYWLGFVSKGHIHRGDPARWSIYPFAYLFYALARGLAGDRYAYPFIDPSRHGWLSVAIYVLVIASGFLIAGYALLRIDRKLARSMTR